MDEASSPVEQNSADVFNRKSRLTELRIRIGGKIQQFEDRIVPFKLGRWGVFAALLLLYFLRVFFFVGGYYIVTYTLCIHLLYCMVVLVTPVSDPENNEDDGLDGVSLSEKQSTEHKPFIPKVQEFKVWRSMIRAAFIAFMCTFFSVFDLPVFWPILLLYFVALFVAQMGGRISHMMKHKYVPWNSAKPKFVSKDDK